MGYCGIPDVSSVPLPWVGLVSQYPLDYRSNVRLTYLTKLSFMLIVRLKPGPPVFIFE